MEEIRQNFKQSKIGIGRSHLAIGLEIMNIKGLEMGNKFNWELLSDLKAIVD